MLKIENVKPMVVSESHSGWISGDAVLAVVKSLKDSALSELFHSRNSSNYFSLFDQVLITICEDGNTVWSIRWSDAYAFIRDYKGTEVADLFVEKTLKIAGIDGISIIANL